MVRLSTVWCPGWVCVNGNGWGWQLERTAGLHWCLESRSLLWEGWFYPSLLMDILDKVVDKGVGKCRYSLPKKA